MVEIKKLRWLSKEALEAEVIITDGRFELICFSQPFKGKKEESLSEPIYAFEVKDIVISASSSFHLEKLDNAFDYLIEGILVNKNLGHIKLGNILIEIESNLIPKDIENGSFISFKCARLDIY